MTPKPDWKVYIIQSSNGKLYTGITNCLDKRLEAHLSKRSGAKFFRFSSPDKIVYSESHPNRSAASKRESFIKKMSRTEKLNMISSGKREN